MTGVHFDRGAFWTKKKRPEARFPTWSVIFFYVWMYGGGPPRSLRTLIKDLLRELEENTLLGAKKNALEENTLPHTMPPGLIHTAVKMDRGQF